MKKVLLATSLMCLSSFALAHGCPGEMKKIDAAMPTAKLSSADMSKVQSLRAKGEEQHKRVSIPNPWQALVKPKR